jgi:hypothetical protein
MLVCCTSEASYVLQRFLTGSMTVEVEGLFAVGCVQPSSRYTFEPFRGLSVRQAHASLVSRRRADEAARVLLGGAC